MRTGSVRLDAVPPFRLDFTAWALRRLPLNKVDRFERGIYSRIFVIGGKPFEVSIMQPSTGENVVEMEVTGTTVTDEVRSEAAAVVGKVLGLFTDLSLFYGMARHDRDLWALVSMFRGLKPPRFPTIYEGVVNGIACQQLSLNVGITLLNRLAEGCGPALDPKNGRSAHAFPAPDDILTLSASSLKKMGFSTRKAEFLLDVSRAVYSGELDLEGLALFDREEAVKFLRGIRGIGRWTAEYVLLRGAGDQSTFPGDDAGGRNKLARWLGISDPLTYGAVQRIMSRWRPFAGLVYFHLLLDELSRKGHVLPTGPAGD